MLLKKNAILAFGLFTFCTVGIAVAQTPPTAEIRGHGQVQGQEQAQTQPTPGQLFIYLYRGTTGPSASTGSWGSGSGNLERVPGFGGCNP